MMNDAENSDVCVIIQGYKNQIIVVIHSLKKNEIVVDFYACRNIPRFHVM